MGQIVQMGLGMYLEMQFFDILLILEGFFFQGIRRLIYNGKYDLHFDLIKGSTSSNRSSVFCSKSGSASLNIDQDIKVFSKTVESEKASIQSTNSNKFKFI